MRDDHLTELLNRRDCKPVNLLLIRDHFSDSWVITYVYCYSLEDFGVGLRLRPRSESLVLNLKFRPLPGHVLPEVTESRRPICLGVQVVAHDFAVGSFVHRWWGLGLLEFNLLFLVRLLPVVVMGQRLFKLIEGLNVYDWIGREPIGRWLLRLRLKGMRARHRDTKDTKENR